MFVLVVRRLSLAVTDVPEESPTYMDSMPWENSTRGPSQARTFDHAVPLGPAALANFHDSWTGGPAETTKPMQKTKPHVASPFQLSYPVSGNEPGSSQVSYNLGARHKSLVIFTKPFSTL